MPYRRLPNTDSARLKALRTALLRGENVSPIHKPFSQNTLQNIKQILPKFEMLIKTQKQAFKNQTDKSPEYNYLFKKAKTYVSHFIQVMGLAVSRGDLKLEAKTYFGLEKYANKLPSIKSESELLKWGEIIIEGEPKRIANGGNPMTNPTIGIVKVHFEKFNEAYLSQRNLHETYVRYSNQVSEMRPQIDKIILQLWNEIEASFEQVDEIQKRNLSREYGLVYFFRRNEVIPELEKVSEDYRKNRVVNKDLRELENYETLVPIDLSDSIGETETEFEDVIEEVTLAIEEQIEDLNSENTVEEEQKENQKEEAHEDQVRSIQYSLF